MRLLGVNVAIESNERRRMDALRRAAIIDTPPEPAFDALTSLATHLFEVPMSLVTFIDEERQWFKSRVGLELTQTARTIAFCENTIATDQVFVVEDARASARFVDNVLVTGPPYIRFYAGAPVRDRDGIAIGAFAILGCRPRELQPTEARLLEKLAASISDELRRRAEARDRGEPSFGPADVRLSFLADRAPVILWTTDRELRITSCTGGALASLGLHARDVVGQVLGDFLGARPDSAIYSAHLRALGQESAEYESTWRERH